MNGTGAYFKADWVVKRATKTVEDIEKVREKNRLEAICKLMDKPYPLMARLLGKSIFRTEEEAKKLLESDPPKDYWPTLHQTQLDQCTHIGILAYKSIILSKNPETKIFLSVEDFCTIRGGYD